MKLKGIYARFVNNQIKINELQWFYINIIFGVNLLKFMKLKLLIIDICIDTFAFIPTWHMQTPTQFTSLATLMLQCGTAAI